MPGRIAVERDHWLLACMHQPGTPVGSLPAHPCSPLPSPCRCCGRLLFGGQPTTGRACSTVHVHPACMCPQGAAATGGSPQMAASCFPPASGWPSPGSACPLCSTSSRWRWCRRCRRRRGSGCRWACPAPWQAHRWRLCGHIPPPRLLCLLASMCSRDAPPSSYAQCTQLAQAAAPTNTPSAFPIHST